MKTCFSVLALLLGVCNIFGANLSFRFGETVDLPGGQVRVPLLVSGFTNVSTMQWSMHWNPDIAMFVKVMQPGLPGLNNANFGTYAVNTGALTCSWDSLTTLPQSLPDGATLLVIQFQIKKQGQSSFIRIDDIPTPIEITDGALNPIAAVFVPGEIAASCGSLVVSTFTVELVPPTAPYCVPPYQFEGYHDGADLPYWRVCRIFGLATVQFPTETNKAYRVQMKFNLLVPHAPENSELGWLYVSPTIQGTGSPTNFQFGVPSSDGYIRVRQL